MKLQAARGRLPVPMPQLLDRRAMTIFQAFVSNHANHIGSVQPIEIHALTCMRIDCAHGNGMHSFFLFLIEIKGMDVKHHEIDIRFH
nr:hypothetical protein [Delftia sp. PS-11]